MQAAETKGRGDTVARVAVDAHGGDHGLVVTVPAVLDALAQDPQLEIILVGQMPALQDALAAQRNAHASRLELAAAADVLPPDAKPAAALRRGRDSSMWHALNFVADGQAGACVSGGSTAALLTLGVKLLGLLPGIQRPALMANIPHSQGHTAMLDLGANLNVSAQQLVQFAVMGAVKEQLTRSLDQPRVGLLNVGHEDLKGHDVVREAHQILKTLPLNYQGFVEGHDLFSGKVDVAVCDGFAGNLVLKSSEGLARMLVGDLRSTLSSSWLSRLGALLARPALRRMLARLDPSAHNGAPLLGLNGVVVKSHGHADRKAMVRAIREAGREARRGVPKKIEASIRAFQLETEA